MIGNDIVDLKNISKRTNWKRPGFIDKVFNENEQRYIRNAKDKDLIVWQLWSMKEAAYKAYVREVGNRFFNPRSIACKIISDNKGEVQINDLIYFTSSELNCNYIHTTASKHIAEIQSSVFKLHNDTYNFQHKMLNQYLLDFISETKNNDSNHLKVVKNKVGVPNVFESNLPLPMQLSLSHCGNYGAFSILNS